MSQRTEDVTIAVLGQELAKLGASVQLLERLVGFGHRKARAVIRGEGGLALGYRQKKDWATWFESDPDRMLHGTFVIMTYRRTSETDHCASRLLEAYGSYREITHNPILGINECAGVIEMVTNGLVWIRECSTCQLPHMAPSEHSECPVCRRRETMLCRRCSGALPDYGTRRTGGRPKFYCTDCEASGGGTVRKSNVRNPCASKSGTASATRDTGSVLPLATYPALGFVRQRG